MCAPANAPKLLICTYRSKLTFRYPTSYRAQDGGDGRSSRGYTPVYNVSSIPLIMIYRLLAPVVLDYRHGIQILWRAPHPRQGGLHWGDFRVAKVRGDPGNCNPCPLYKVGGQYVQNIQEKYIQNIHVQHPAPWIVRQPWCATRLHSFKYTQARHRTWRSCTKKKIVEMVL